MAAETAEAPKKRKAPLSEAAVAQVDERIADLDARDLKRLMEFARQACTRQGYTGLREGGLTFRRIRATVYLDIRKHYGAIGNVPAEE